MDRFFQKIEEKVDRSGQKVEQKLAQSIPDVFGKRAEDTNRYQSFAAESSGLARWHVDGASYFWALSTAIEGSRNHYCMDWWLSPELYLHRPPSQNERYRLDLMLKAAAERGVQVRVMVYKEVPQALTLNSEHTKNALEALHPNIKVFRHPDHIVTGSTITSEFTTGLQNALSLAKMPGEALKVLFGTLGDTDIGGWGVGFWAHHDKMLVVDNRVAFMGGLDACFGRWDTHDHAIADVHPSNPDSLIFPGQDYNNARVFDFEGVDKWDHNQLDRNLAPRMSWSDISVSLAGPIVTNLVAHFVDRWNFIFGQKYNTEEAVPPNIDLLEEAKKKAVEVFDDIEQRFRKHMPNMPDIPNIFGDPDAVQERRANFSGSMNIQLVRSASEWSHAYAPTGHNKIGAALAPRIVRAHKNAEVFPVIVLIPAIPGFAGDLKADDALGTRAVMEFQYHSINRGGHSIIEKLVEAGVTQPDKYISFYNLRNCDRIRKYPGDPTFDSVAASSTFNGPQLNQIPREGSLEEEIDVSEELYIHTKVLIADDRRVICGSANLNDRSQLGDHDSEIVVVIDNAGNPIQTQMGGRSFTANKFAASLRRLLYRKHLGLLPSQRADLPDGNFHPVVHSPADRLVADPLSHNFDQLWRGQARTNTEVFSKVFHNVPNDAVRTWDQYNEFFTKYFYFPGTEEANNPDIKATKVMYGHVVKSEFPGGAGEVKQWLSRVRGSLVEMPLQFLADVKDIAKEGLMLNNLTDDLYT
ncbi:phospholipase D/nuclease [Gonapodya prolifera JEL478]|uniref:phospholipase D n=1 Tax=Gonapodya prolifera (strain JEL478) TaxID=1344416 RepID=A0A138ZXN3_GONPJ|nr:phospholipase D/nuclease [Gonapodya prolifera JEL478]|eukprot:KXS09244.1 phospholipase D/nuclease [Gonapodya prolifera JEL478]